MIQCIICEDWYHTRHLGVEVPGNAYAEMICEGCVRKNEFLLYYDGLAINSVQPETSNLPVDVTETLPTTSEIKAENLDTSFTAEPTADLSGDFLKTIDKAQEDKLLAIVDCKMPKIKSQKICAKFWADTTWRQQLCTCMKCLKMYENLKVMFLIEAQDPVQIYEEKGAAKAIEMEQNQEQLLNSLDRVPLMETIAAYNDLKSELAEFLKKFAENKKVVREEDVKEFFEGMKARKRQRVEVPYFCR